MEVGYQCLNWSAQSLLFSKFGKHPFTQQNARQHRKSGRSSKNPGRAEHYVKKSVLSSEHLYHKLLCSIYYVAIRERILLRYVELCRWREVKDIVVWVT
jgi:hypothetical protein